MEDESSRLSRLAYFTSFAHIRALQLKLEAMESVLGEMDPALQEKYITRSNELLSTDTVLADFREKIRGIEESES